MEPIVSFARGVPAPECLAEEELADCARAVLDRDGKTILSYGSGAGYAPLRETIAEWFEVPPHRVLLTNGALQGFVLLAQHFGRGKTVLVELPTYDRPLKILHEGGQTAVPVAMDEHGLVPGELEKALAENPDPAFLYTIPTFQNPSGRTLPADRRRRVVELAATAGTLIVEDDPYGMIRFEGEAEPSMFELSGGTIIYTSSFSKTIAPGLRVGFYIVPEELAGPLTDRANCDLHHAGPAEPGGGARVHRPRQLRAEPRQDQRPPASHGATRCSPRSTSTCPAPPGRIPTAATSSGSSSPRAPMPPR